MVSAAISARLAIVGELVDGLPEPAVGALAFVVASLVVAAAVVATVRPSPVVATVRRPVLVALP